MSNQNKLKKIIFYSAVPISKVWGKKWGIEEFSNFGFDIEIWLSYEIFYEKHSIQKITDHSKNYFIKSKKKIMINNFSVFENKIKQIDKNTLFFILNRGPAANLNFDNRDLDILNKYNIKYTYRHLIPYPFYKGFYSKFRFYLREIKRRIYNYKMNPVLIFVAGSEAKKQVSRTYNNKIKIVSVPSLNILWKKVELKQDTKFIVYVDEAADFSPDALLFKQNKACIDVEGFYLRLNQLFNKFEEWTFFKVIIAASDKFKYLKNPFGGREIVYSKTPELIQNSQLIIGHKSSALEQALVENKPLFLFKDLGLSKLKNNIIDQMAYQFQINSFWMHKFSKKNFEENNFSNRLKNIELVRRYLKEDGISGSFVKNIITTLNDL